MKITLDRGIFLSKLKLIGKNASGSDKTPSGIQRHLYAEIHKKKIIMKNWNGLTLLATTMVEGILEIELAQDKATILISLEKLMGIAQSSSTKKISIEEINETKFKVRANGTSFISGMPSSEFPVIDLQGEEIFKTTLAKFIKRATIAASCVANDSNGRVELEGMLWNGDFVSTDGGKASIVQGKKLDKNFIIPSGSISLLRDIYNEIGDKEMTISTHENHTLLFQTDGLSFMTGLIQANFPGYQSMIDAAVSEKSVIFNREEMKDVLRRCDVFEDKLVRINKNIVATISLNIDEGKLKIRIGEEEHHSEFVKSAKVETGEKTVIFLKLQPLMDCMNLAPEEEIKLEYTSVDRPVFVKQGKWIYLMMPIIREV